MPVGKRFFIVRAGRDGRSSVISKKAAFITRYSSTSYKDVLELSFEDMEKLFGDLCELIKIEAEVREKAFDAKESENG